VEGIRRKPVHPRAVQAFQAVGVALICGLMLFALFGDILYLFRL
jgi:regulator of sigma E protease